MLGGDERVDVDAWSLSYARVGAAGRVVRRERYRGSRERAWLSGEGLLIVPPADSLLTLPSPLGAHQRTFSGVVVLAQRRCASGGACGRRGRRGSPTAAGISDRSP